VNEVFSAWKVGLPYYGTAFGITLIVFALLHNRGLGWVALPLLLLSLFMLAFFRDFPRAITAAENEAVSPADGTIVAIEDFESSPHYDGPCRRVSIFLSVFNAHINRAPFGGTITRIDYKEGQFLDARLPETSEKNESNTVRMQTPWGDMTVRQISGAVARRIVCPAEAGMTLKKGEKFGMIRFGSRTELYLPPGTEVCVKMGEKVYAGSSVIARF